MSLLAWRMRTRKRWRGVAGCGKTLAEQGIRGAKMKKRGPDEMACRRKEIAGKRKEKEKERK